MYDVFGMTETSGAVTANGPEGFRLGTVGRANPGIELRLAEDGEVLVRGPVTTRGTTAARRRPAPSWTTTAGCTPATSAPSTTRGSMV